MAGQSPTAVEHAIVQHALSRGFLNLEQVREALLLQGQLEAASRPAALLDVLRTRHLSADQVRELKSAYLRSTSASSATATDTSPLPPPLEIPEEVLARLAVDVRRPRAGDPQAVSRMLATFKLPSKRKPPSPAPDQTGYTPTAVSGSGVYSPEQERATAARARVAAAYAEVSGLDPHFVPHVDAVLERLDTLGSGGMGVVYRVRDKRLGREAALKLIRADRATDKAVRRFKREVEITARLDHPAIPPVYDAGTNTDGHFFMLMRAIGGEPLSKLIRAFHAAHASLVGGAHELRKLLEVLVKVGEAMAYAHSQGVIHRDLKPANVMVGQFGEVMVLDWGLARAGDAKDEEGLLGTQLTQSQLEEAVQSKLTVPGALLGTMGYAAPEQVRGEPVGERADVFSLGALLAEVLTGASPAIRSESFVEVFAAAQAGRVVLPSERRNDVPPELSSIVERALSPKPRGRHPNAQAFVEDLKSYLAGLEVASHSYGSFERIKRLARRHPAMLVGVAGGTVAVLLVGLALAFAAQQRAVAAHQQAKAAEQQAKAAEQEAIADRQLAERKSAEERRAEAERASRELAAEKAKSLVYTDGGRLKILRQQASELSPSSRDLPALERWSAEAKALLAPDRREVHEARRAELEAVQDPSGTQRAELAALEELLTGLRKLEARPSEGVPTTQTVASVEQRLLLASKVRAQTVTGETAAASWKEASSAIATDSRYGGLRLQPLEGLLPIGRDEASGLWEFWHVASGERPARRSNGRLALEERSGIVLVLIPGGTFQMGSDVAEDEQPIHSVRLGAFFMSKYEMTQGQWLRATGVNPSQYQPGQATDQPVTLLQPVEQVSWEDCVVVLRRLGLGLPSESQWEYATRAGTTTTWWTGDTEASLQGAANVADSYLRKSGGKPGWTYTEEVDDRWTIPAPVGTYRANAFGLHDVMGNLWEWVQDSYQATYQGVPSDGSAHEIRYAPNRVRRGGCWGNVADSGRSADRGRHNPAGRSLYLGVRPALQLGQ